MWEPEWNDAGSVACGDSRRAGWPQRALEFLPGFWQQAELLVNICTYLRKSQKSAKCLAQFTGTGIAENGSLTAAANSWRANGVTNYTNRP